MSVVQILLNGDPFEVSVDSSLSMLVDQLGLKDKRYAIEVNEQIIPRSQHDSFVVKANDKVEIVQAIGGG